MLPVRILRALSDCLRGLAQLRARFAQPTDELVLNADHPIPTLQLSDADRIGLLFEVHLLGREYPIPAAILSDVVGTLPAHLLHIIQYDYPIE